MAEETEKSKCPVCGGTGWKMVPAEDKLGRTVNQATRCECRLREYGNLLMEQARLPRRYLHCEFDSFDHTGPQRSLEKAYLSAMRFVEEYPVEHKGLLLVGPIGCGKTHLAVSILKQLILTKSVPCLFYDYRELLKQIQNTYNDSVPATEMDILRPVFDVEVLVLDELGAAKPSDWVWDTVSHILNTRYNEDRTTIITTNYLNQPAGGSEPLKRNTAAARAAREETLGDRIGDRMYSRLQEMCRIIPVEGEDYRQTMLAPGNRFNSLGRN
jgi:DNA replication protein DnaC